MVFCVLDFCFHPVCCAGALCICVLVFGDGVFWFDFGLGTEKGVILIERKEMW